MTIEDLHKDLPEKKTIEITDAIQFFLRSNADQQMRLVIYFAQPIDFNFLKKAIRLTIYQEPIFSYTYKEYNQGAYWQKQPEIVTENMIDLIETTGNPEVEVNKFLTTIISPFEFPLVKVRVVRYNNKDVLCINMNHTLTDGSGLKQFARLLAINYNKIIEDPGYVCEANVKGDRSIKQVTNHFSLGQKINFIRQGFKRPPRRESWSFDWGKTEGNNKNQFAFVRISGETFERLKLFGKTHKATVNDIVIAAFVRSFVRTRQNNYSVSKPMIIPVDLRKYGKPGHKSAICSLTGSMVVNVGNEIGDTFEETLRKTVKETTFNKSIHAEMNMLTPFLVMGKLMPYAKLKEKMMQRKMPPIPLITNIGVINPDDINFNHIPVEQSFATGVVSYGNYFSMGYSTFNKEMTFSVGFNGNDMQKQKIGAFLSDFKSEIESIGI
ncbi:MAG TPA: hypothetical protein VHO72_11190 [Bacteroidales bacterium]|nr:hypothetical protein [Bacteroidales bacterium]